MGNPKFTWNGYHAGIRECSQYFDNFGGDFALGWFLDRLAYRRAAFTRGFVRAAVDCGYLDPEEGIEVVERLAKPHWKCLHYSTWLTCDLGWAA